MSLQDMQLPETNTLVIGVFILIQLARDIKPMIEEEKRLMTGKLKT